MKKIETNEVKTKPVPFLVNVIGNICSGKSTLMDKLLDVYPEAHFLKIDDYRKQFNAVDSESDNYAWQQLINDAISKDFVFVESTGASANYKALQEKFPGTILTIFVTARFDICLKRYELRQNNLQISNRYSIQSSMDYILNALHHLWSFGISQTVINTDNGIDELDMEYIITIIYSTRRISLVKNTKPNTPDGNANI